MTRAMKNSGVEWIGQIPESWNTIRLKMIAPILRGASPRPINDPKYFDDNGNYYWVRINDVTKSNGYLYSCAQKLSNIGAELSVKLEPNTLFISICATLGKPCITKIPCCIHDGFIYFYRLDKRLNKYLYYVFEAGKCFEGLAKLGTQQNLNTFLIGNIKIALPYNHKQIQAIADYLDDKCAQIDNITATINEQIEVLKQYKKSVITEAVTKGLDPNVPMKDSGVEWIGQIPEKWNIERFKYNFSFAKGLQITKADLTEEGCPVISYGQIHSKINTGVNVNSELIRFVSTDYQYEKSSIAKYGDIIWADTSEDYEGIGNSIFINCSKNIFAGYHTIITKPLFNSITKYFAYLFQTDVWRLQLRKQATGIKVFSITQKMLKNCNILIPSIPEQQVISDYLDDKCAQIDAVIADKQAQLETLAAYKKSLIYECVTGKKSVPGFEEA